MRVLCAGPTSETQLVAKVLVPLPRAARARLLEHQLRVKVVGTLSDQARRRLHPSPAAGKVAVGVVQRAIPQRHLTPAPAAVDHGHDIAADEWIGLQRLEGLNMLQQRDLTDTCPVRHT